jgi:hypothetical protein
MEQNMSKEVNECLEDMKKFANEVSPHFYKTVKEFLLFIRSIVDAGIEITESKIKTPKNQNIEKVDIK